MQKMKGESIMQKGRLLSNPEVYTSIQWFSFILQALRKRAGYSQKIFARLTGLTRYTISKLEQGYKLPNSYHLIKIVKVLKVSTDYLLGVSPKKQNSGIYLTFSGTAAMGRYSK